MKRWVLWAVILCVPCIEWTRFSGTVKTVNLKDSVVTVQNHDGDLISIPVDFQVTITDKHGDKKGLSSLVLDDKITLTRVLSAPVKDETTDEMNTHK